MSRVPSFHTLALLYKAYNHKDTAKPGQIRQEKIFYVLNPEQNLPKTQERLEPTLAEMNIGAGKIGEQPRYTAEKLNLKQENERSIFQTFWKFHSFTDFFTCLS